MTWHQACEFVDGPGGEGPFLSFWIVVALALIAIDRRKQQKPIVRARTKTGTGDPS